MPISSFRLSHKLKKRIIKKEVAGARPRIANIVLKENNKVGGLT